MKNVTYRFSVGHPVGGSEEPETIVHTAEPSLTDKTDLAEELRKAELDPTSKDYSAEWDAQQ